MTDVAEAYNYVGERNNLKHVRDRVYLPSQDGGVEIKEYLFRYVEREFPEAEDGRNAVYSVPPIFQKNTGEKQANLAEQVVFSRLHGLTEAKNLQGLWMTFFYSASYAGRSFRNQRFGKLMIREHDFVIFVRYRGKFLVVLAEIKSTHDTNTHIKDLEITSDAKVIKNNKRSAQHQLRDHMEVLQGILGVESVKNNINCFIMWPFLGAMTRDPKHQIIRRWKEDEDLHVFENVLQCQDKFNKWFEDKLLVLNGTTESDFITLLYRYIVLSCGNFVNEIHESLMALLTQEQIKLLNSDICRNPNRWPTVVHGAAGTGKTLLVLRKLEQLHQEGKLNEQNRALYVCYWPGIRYDTERKLKILGIDKYVDTARFYISLSGFLDNNKKKYKHVFVDEAEVICLAFESDITTKTVSKIYQRYHAGNCIRKECEENKFECDASIIKEHLTDDCGELWFLVDINQAILFLPKYSPQVLKTPSIILTKVMRSTGFIFNVFKQFYSKPMPLLPPALLAKLNIPNISIGHHISGPPIYWVDSENQDCSDAKSCVLCGVVHVIVDLCSTKGFKPNDICVIPFLFNEHFNINNINKRISDLFVENGYRPKAVGDVEEFIGNKQVNDFLVSWALRVKGLEFKVVVVAFDEDFDAHDSEDRSRTYIITSRCTCMLVVVSTKEIMEAVDNGKTMQKYPFSLSF